MHIQLHYTVASAGWGSNLERGTDERLPRRIQLFDRRFKRQTNYKLHTFFNWYHAVMGVPTNAFVPRVEYNVVGVKVFIL